MSNFVGGVGGSHQKKNIHGMHKLLLPGDKQIRSCPLIFTSESLEVYPTQRNYQGKSLNLVFNHPVVGHVRQADLKSDLKAKNDPTMRKNLQEGSKVVSMGSILEDEVLNYIPTRTHRNIPLEPQARFQLAKLTTGKLRQLLKSPIYLLNLRNNHNYENLMLNQPYFDTEVCQGLSIRPQTLLERGY